MVHVVIDRYFSLFLKGLKTFLNPRLSLIVRLTGIGETSSNEDTLSIASYVIYTKCKKMSYLSLETPPCI